MTPPGRVGGVTAHSLLTASSTQQGPALGALASAATDFRADLGSGSVSVSVSGALAAAVTMLDIPFESPSWPACTLSYRVFHLQWTIPLCLALFLLNRPFLTKLDYAKLTLLPIIAFVWTTPWDNVIVKNHAWFYRRHCIWFTVGYVPIEEYFFFIIQSIMTTLWCSFITRWRLPNLYITRRPGKGSSSPRMKLSNPAVAVALVILCAGLRAAQPASSSYYIGMILWWSAIPLGLLMWGSIDFIFNMGLWAGLIPFTISVMVPTIYLWCSDIYALRRGTWHINESTSLKIFPLPDLPIEEMLFFVVTNAILVTACFAFDRCVAICRTSEPSQVTLLSPSYLPLGAFSTYKKLWLAFIQTDGSDNSAAESSIPNDTSVSPRDLQLSLEVLKQASKSFNAASLLLPWDLRTDLGCLYAFCRLADDLVDEEKMGIEQKSRNLQTIRDTVDALYDEVAQKDNRGRIDFGLVKKKVNAVLLAVHMPEAFRVRICAAACSIAPLARIIPRRLWLEMLKGYKMDLDFEQRDPTLRTKLEKMDELVEYSQCVAGVVGEMCTRVILARCGVPVALDLEVDRDIDLASATSSKVDAKTSIEAPSVSHLLDLSSTRDIHKLLYEARRMGVSLQLVNIARDIVPDSIELGRCYLPFELLNVADPIEARSVQTALLNRKVILPDQLTSKDQNEAPDPDSIRPVDVRKYALRLLDIAKKLYAESFPALSQIPNRPARAGLRAACSVYAAIGTKIESQTLEEIGSGKRARMSHLDRIRRALSAVYLGV